MKTFTQSKIVVMAGLIHHIDGLTVHLVTDDEEILETHGVTHQWVADNMPKAGQMLVGGKVMSQGQFNELYAEVDEDGELVSGLEDGQKLADLLVEHCNENVGNHALANGGLMMLSTITDTPYQPIEVPEQWTDELIDPEAPSTIVDTPPVETEPVDQVG